MTTSASKTVLVKRQMTNLTHKARLQTMSFIEPFYFTTP